jgi:opacity protein-like surface antigen
MRFLKLLMAFFILSFYMASSAAVLPTSLDNAHPYFLELGLGYSFSMPANIKVDTSYWDAAVQGYNSRLENAFIFGAGIGYHATKLLDISISAAYRGTYHYKKYQNKVPGSKTPYPGDTKTRYFDLDNANLMFNFLLHNLDKVSYRFHNGVIITPFIGGGIGIARNTVSNFYSVKEERDPVSHNKLVSAIEPDKETYSLAAQGVAGISFILTQRTNLDLGYRIYYGGKFKSNDHLVDYESSEHVPAWKGRLLANEIFIQLNFSFGIAK